MANPQTQKTDEQIPQLRLQFAQNRMDSATILGLIIALSVIGVALYMGGNLGAFVNLPSILIVVGGTCAITLTSFSMGDIAALPKIIGRAIFRRDQDVKQLMKQLLEIASIAKKHGVLSLQKIENSVRRDRFLHRAVQFVSDGYTAPDIQRILTREIDSIRQRHKQSVDILYRAAEVAPAMGLIGTLVGLVHMLAHLDDPSIIGPSMAVALLTTLYGAFLGTVILSPLAAKLDRNSAREELEKTLIMLSALSMAKHENPRRLEMQMNSEVSPTDEIRFFENLSKK